MTVKCENVLYTTLDKIDNIFIKIKSQHCQLLSSQEANYLMVPSAMCLLRASAGGQGASMPLCPGCPLMVHTETRR